MVVKQNMQPEISVIIPAYNEEGVIEDNINQVAEFLFRHQGRDRDFEIIVVDDGSSDHTGEVLDRLAEERPYLTALHHPRNLGRGRGLRTGFEHASGRFVFTLDADLSYTPDHIARMLEPLRSGRADIVLASAYHPQGSVANVPRGRALVSRMGNKLLALSLNIKLNTFTCVVRGYNREALEALELFSDDKDIHLEIIKKAKILGLKVMEVPANLKWRNNKRTSGRKGLTLGAFRRMAQRHLFINFLLRPSMIFWAPIIFVFLTFLAVSVTMVIGYRQVLLQHPPAEGLLRYYYALGEHINWASASYFVWSLCIIILFQFLSLIFIAKQANYNYEDVFAFLSRLKKRLKALEDKE